MIRTFTAMPFGKHKNIPIDAVDGRGEYAVPMDYLAWVIDETDWADTKPDIFEMIEREFSRRKREGVP